MKGTEETIWFSVTSRAARALECQCHFTSGAVRDALPLSALTYKPDHQEHIPLEHLQLWNCFSEHIVCHEYAWLSGLRAETMLKDHSVHEGTYVFTLDWHGNSVADSPGEGGHKSAHVIRLDCGCIAAQPNNRILFREGSFAVNPISIKDAPKLGWKVNTQAWRVERQAKWATEDSDQFFYGGR